MRTGITFLIIASVTLCAQAMAYDWSTNPGDGSPENPYQISEPNHLIAIGSNADLLDKHFVLVNDIVFDPNSNPVHEFDNALIALDTDNSNYYFTDIKFTGVFDGQGYGIYNFQCIFAEGDYMGLFGYTDSSSLIRNVHLYDVNVQGDYYVGGLVALNYGTVENCSVTGTVAGRDKVGGVIGMNEEGSILKDSHCDITILDPYGDIYEGGGLIGYNFEGDVINCYSTGVVYGGDDSCMVGGLAGFNRGRIRQCYSTADVLCTGWYIGGLIGEHDWYELVDCYATGDVSGADGIGGLLGRSYWDVSRCYATGSIEGTRYNSGGLIGELWNGTIRQCYASGTVTGVYDPGGLIGTGDEDSQCIDSFWDLDISGQSESFGGIGLSTNDLQNEQVLISYGWDFSGETLNGYSEDWAMPVGGGYPILWTQMDPQPVLPAFSGGSGTPEDPFLIADANDLRGIGHNPRMMDKHFRLMNEIDLNGIAYFPIADGGYPFMGSIDGNDHTIRNLSYTVSSKSKVGMVANLGETGRIKNLGLTGVNINVSGYSEDVGGLVGYNLNGQVHNCSVSGFVEGNITVGLLIGNNEGGTISNCYAMGSIIEGNSVGGLVGRTSDGAISNSYAAVEVLLANSAGVFIGGSTYTVYDGCFWHNGLNDVVSGYSSYVNIPGISELSDTAMRSESSFVSAGWDFAGENVNGDEDIWTMSSYGYPMFRWQAESIVPDVQGMTIESSVTALHAVGLNSWHIRRGYSDIIPEGSVICSDPEGGSQVAESTPIYMTVSAGPCPYSGGIGTEQEPCRITTAADLQTLGQTPDDYDMHFVLTDDIDLAGVIYEDALIAPYLYISNGFQGSPFTGIFDGQGHSINGLNINPPASKSYLGLFGKIGCNGVVQNLALSNAVITAASTYNGIIVGSCESGMIKHCTVSGSITGGGYNGAIAGQNYRGMIDNTTADISINTTGWYVGGLTARNYGIISQCGVSGIVKGGSDVGGLCGTSSVKIMNSYARVSLTASRWPVGGLIGTNYSSLTHCFAACTGGAGLVGKQPYSPTYTACFWDKTINSAAGVGGGVPLPSGMLGLTTTQMKTKSYFTARGWDFVGESVYGNNDIWRMCADGVAYPRLSWEFAKDGDFACGDGVDMGDLAAIAGRWLLTEAAHPTSFSYACDANGDGQINLLDLEVLSRNWE